jgi:predicted RNA-binding Zn ribbon-like protein
VAEGSVEREAELLRAFVNTRDVEAGTDALAGPDALVGWLAAAALLDAEVSATADDVALALALREELRKAMRHHHGGVPPAAGSLSTVGRRLPLVLDVVAEPPTLRPLDTGVRGALARLLALVPAMVADGSWARLKVCPADDCAWAFYDSSRNRSRTWCAMSVCGNRTKTRAYRARRRTSS